MNATCDRPGAPPGGWGAGDGHARGVRYPVRMSSPPLFADDNSAFRRAARRAEQEERVRAERRREIMATLRRLKDEASDPAALDARLREERHASLLERYPPQY